MWSYRLYRYPSPSSGLVYGANKEASDHTVAHEAKPPQAVAQAVHLALFNGLKLPPLNDSEELRAALLAFQPPALSSESQEADVANRTLGEGRSDEDEAVRSQAERPAKAAPSREDGSRKRPPSCSLLMLEALSRRRMDAVRQLHEICPQLLASIPLFDLRPAAHSSASLDGRSSASSVGPNPSVPLSCTHTSPVPCSASATSSVILIPNTCQVPQSSRLLDLAAENQSLLVFVLQHHPEVNKQSGHQLVWKKDSAAKSIGSRGQISKKCDVYGSIGSAHDACQYHVNVAHAQPKPPPTDSSAQKKHEGTKNEGSEAVQSSKSENKEEDKKTDGGEEDLLEDLDPNNPVTICIRKNNAEVLQYLLFKHVWQHFLLDEVFNLPHNSYVPEMLLEELLHTCPDCPWFVHCAALMGCPPLLQLVLSGHFCQHQPPLSSPPTSRGIRHAAWAPSPASEGTARSTPSGMQSLSENPEVSLRESHSDNSPGQVTDSPETVSGQKQLEDTKSSDPGMVDERSPSDKQSVTHTPTRSTSSDQWKNIPSCSLAPNVSVQGMGTTCSTSKTSESETASTSQKPKEKVSPISEVPAASRSLLQQPSFSVTVPDPNKTFPMSLPVMDRWISRCMNVRLTPLHLACWRCDPASIKVLLSHGADASVLAEELATPEPQREGEALDLTSSQTSGQASAESSVELSLNFLSVTLNSSSLDLTTRHGSMEDILKGDSPISHQQGGLTALAMLALGIRSPPDFSLSIGKFLGLVLPTLPELWGGQVERSCWHAKQSTLEALHMLLEAGCDVNMSSQVFGKSYRVMELFLQPSVDLYYAPLMPRGGRDSAVLRCMDLERVADVVLSACWELCSHGARLGPCFAASLEWNLFRMDWMFLQNEALQTRFMHLAIFLGLFPPLDPALYMDTTTTTTTRRASVSHPSGEESQSSVSPTLGGLDLREPQLPPYSPPPPPPRPSCVPWAPTTPRMSSFSQLPEMSGEGVLTDGNWVGQQSEGRVDIVTTYYSSVASQTVEPPQERSPGAEEPALEVTPPVSRTHFDGLSTGFHYHTPSPANLNLPPSPARTTPSQQHATTSIPGPGPATKAQMTLWRLEERQRRCLEKFANECIRLSMSESCLALVLRFLCVPDLQLLSRMTQHLLHTSPSAMESPLQRLNHAVCQAQLRTLQHSCKQAVLLAVRWRPHAVHCLPLPDCLKRYLLDPH